MLSLVPDQMAAPRNAEEDRDRAVAVVVIQTLAEALCSQLYAVTAHMPATNTALAWWHGMAVFAAMRPDWALAAVQQAAPSCISAAPPSRPGADRTAFWTALNRYIEACGGDPHWEPTERMRCAHAEVLAALDRL